MKGRYEIRDTHQSPPERGMRYTALERARKELAQCVPPGRFVIFDRQDREVVQ